MARIATQVPDYSVKSSEKHLDEEKQVRYRSSFIGVGWRNTDEKGEERINVMLHALPMSGELVLWKYLPRDAEAIEPAKAKAKSG